jgi:pimeloyl-ACP methyl ester carboxylesterase
MRLSRLLPIAAALLMPRLTAAQAWPQPPIVFVHGNGDHAGLWDNTIWRFESNGYRRDRLFAIDLPKPVGSSTISAREPNRSTPEEQMQALAAAVAAVQRRTGQRKVVLIGSSRGGLTIRNYVRFGGGAAQVSHVITCGTPNHGVLSNPTLQPEGEFNGAGAFLRALNGGDEVVPGVRFLTLRSDSLDKYAQRDGAALGARGVPTGIDERGPELRGAENLVLPGTDHREVAFGGAAFAAQFRFITGVAPRDTLITVEARPKLSGMVSLNRDGAPTNIGVPGAMVTVHAVDTATGVRLSRPSARFVTGADGRWGPFRSAARTAYEFEIAAPDSSVLLHVYRSPIPRSSTVINFRLPAPPSAAGDSVSVLVIRPRGYFGAGRDTVTVDGRPARGIPPGVPTVDRVLHWVPRDSARTVTVRVNGETLRVRTVPGDPRRLVSAELQRED